MTARFGRTSPTFAEWLSDYSVRRDFPQAGTLVVWSASTCCNLRTSPRFLRRAEKKLRRAQRALSRKEKGSRNRDKARVKVARAHARVTDARRDFTTSYPRR